MRIVPLTETELAVLHEAAFAKLYHLLRQPELSAEDQNTVQWLRQALAVLGYAPHLDGVHYAHPVIRERLETLLQEQQD